MFQKYMQNYKTNHAPANDTQGNGRREMRRTQDLCVLAIDGKIFPVEDWSTGGILFHADTQRFAVGKSHNLTIKFKLHDRIIDVNHTGQVIRKTHKQVAIQFDPLPSAVSKKFRTVMNYNKHNDTDLMDGYKGLVF